MALRLNRSISVNLSCGQSAHPPVMRSVSYRQTCSNVSQRSNSFSTDTLPKLHDLKNCLADAKAQIDAFVKEFPQYWNIGDTNILIRYKDAVKRLPRVAAQLSSCELKKLQFVKNILRNMKANLANSLKRTAESDAILSSYLERAERVTGNAILLCVNAASDLHFDKELSSANDIMSVAMIVKQYFTIMVNEIGSQLNKDQTKS